jgi:hypothetical protein
LARNSPQVRKFSSFCEVGIICLHKQNENFYASRNEHKTYFSFRYSYKSVSVNILIVYYFSYAIFVVFVDVDNFAAYPRKFVCGPQSPSK